MEKQSLKVQIEESIRLDKYLISQLSDYTRSYWTNMIKSGYVLVNNEKTKPGYVLKNGETIEVSWPRAPKHAFGKLEILFEDDDIVALNKPAGMLVHSKGAFNPEYTFADYVKDNFDLTGFDEKDDRKGIVHRLDRQTSGVIVVAKNPSAHTEMQKLFADRQIEKHYIAIIEGTTTEESFAIDVPLARSKSNPKTFIGDINGKDAISNIKLLSFDQAKNTSVLLITPETGRTHQIRSHLSHIGKPIVGDMAYGSKTQLDEGRFMLHAFSLRFVSPFTKKKQHFIAQIPSDMTPYIQDGEKESIFKEVG